LQIEDILLCRLLDKKKHLLDVLHVHKSLAGHLLMQAHKINLNIACSEKAQVYTVKTVGHLQLQSLVQWGCFAEHV
jgi:hypothetical protein